MRTALTIALAVLATTILTPSCSQIWDPTAQQQARESLIAITVSSRIRNDANKPKKELAYKEAATILEEFIASGNTDSEELTRLLTEGLSKYLSASLAAAITGDIMNMITDLAGSADPEAMLKAEKTILTGIQAGIAMSATTDEPTVIDDPAK